VNPWIHDFAAYDLWARPMGLLVLATRLRNLGWEPRLVDCLDRDHPSVHKTKLRLGGHGRFPKSAIPKPEALSHVPRTYSRYGIDPEALRKDLESLSTPQAIMVTGLMTYWYPGVVEVIALMKQTFPAVPIFLGGVYATLMPEHAQRNSDADMVIPGPVEANLAQILSQHTKVPTQNISSLNEWEFSPALDLLSKVHFIPLLTSRGCPFTCSYCASRKLAPRFVRRSTDDVIYEMEKAHTKYGVQDIALYDDAFLVDAKNHALPLLKHIAERIPGLRWHSPNGLHASNIDEETAVTMKSAGFETIRLGLERASDEFHSQTGGKTSREAFLTAVKNLREAGFDQKQIGAYLLVGLPGQTRDEIEADVELVLEAGALPKLAEYSPIPGTVLWEKAMLSTRYPIDTEPLFHNCSLLAAADPEVDWEFLRTARNRIAEQTIGLSHG
jgi:radical SAM superfamily enzyme YgiQ (UPF0313 family)